jgi:hypothetical protein
MLLLALALFAASPESQLFEDDVTLPRDYTWTELLSQLRDNPLDLNRATAAELLQLPWLTPAMVRAVMARRSQQGKFRNLDQLIGLGTIDSSTVEDIRPYLRVATRPSETRTAEMVRIASDDLSRSRGLLNYALAERVQAEFQNLRLSLVSAKDIGEQDPFDLLSGGAEYHRGKTRLLAGDYELQFGQGLVFSRPGSFWLSSNSLRLPSPTAISIAGTFAENTFLHGLAWNQGTGPFTTTLFLSRSRLDAVPNPDSTINNISYEGLHDDSATSANKGRLVELLGGARIAARRQDFTVGLFGYANRYDLTIRADRNGFSGRSLALVASDLGWTEQNYCLTAEVAHALSHGWAGAGDLFGDWPQLKTHLSLGYFAQDFYSPHSRNRDLSRAHGDLDGTFRMSYRWQDWTGVFYGTTSRDFVLDSMPARIQLNIENRQPKFTYRLQWQQSFKDEFARSIGTRLDVTWLPLRNFNLGFRLDDRFQLANPGLRGLAFSLGLGIDQPGCNLDARVVRFMVAAPECRIYAYEPGFPANNRSFTGNGWRGYAALTTRLFDWLAVNAKFGVTMDAATTCDAGLSLSFRY